MEDVVIVTTADGSRQDADQRAVADTYRAETLVRLRGDGPAALWSSPGGVVVLLGNLLHLFDVECDRLRETIDFEEANSIHQNMLMLTARPLRWMTLLESILRLL